MVVPSSAGIFHMNINCGLLIFLWILHMSCKFTIYKCTPRSAELRGYMFINLFASKVMKGSPHGHWNRIQWIRMSRSGFNLVSRELHTGHRLRALHWWTGSHALSRSTVTQAQHAARIWIEAVWRQSRFWIRIPDPRIGSGSKVPCGEPQCHAIATGLTLLLLCTSAPFILCCDQFDRGSSHVQYVVLNNLYNNKGI